MRHSTILCEVCKRKLADLNQIDSANIYIDFAICDSCNECRAKEIGDCEE